MPYNIHFIYDKSQYLVNNLYDIVIVNLINFIRIYTMIL